MDYSSTKIQETADYYLYEVDLDFEAGENIADVRDGEVNRNTVTLPVQLNTGGSIGTEDVTVSTSESLCATNSYFSSDGDTLLLFLWKQRPEGPSEGTVYAVPREYAYDPRNQLDPYKEYKAYKDPENSFEKIRSKIGKTVAPIVDNMKQGMLGDDWITVLRDEEVVEVEITADGIKLAVVHVSVEIRVYLIVEETVDGKQREVVKQFSYAPPFPITADGARIGTNEGLSVIAPRCELADLTTAPFFVPLD